MSRRVNGIESDQASMRSAFLPAGKEMEGAEQLRVETQQLLEQTETKRLTAEREAERRAALSRDSLVRPMREQSERLDKIERSLEQIGALRSEQDRLMGMIPALQQRIEDLAKKLEEPDRRLAFLEEQRRADSRRLSSFRRRFPKSEAVEAVRPKLELLGGDGWRTEKRVLETQGSERERASRFSSSSISRPCCSSSATNG